jgi:phosphoglycerate dehydrogenase-like enzyme
MKFLIAMGEGEIRDSFFTPRALAELARHGELVFNATGQHALDKAALIEHLQGVDVLLSGWGTARVDTDVLATCPQLKVHAHTGGSLAPFVCREEYERGVVVLSGNELYARSVAEGCLAYTLIALRRADVYMSTMRCGGWRPVPDHTQGLCGKRLGLVGYGAIARHYAELLRWFGLDLLVYSQHVSAEELARVGARRASKEEIFSTCDIVSLHSALNAENRGMVTAELLRTIRDGALFVNTARAGLVDDAALQAELALQRFSAVLDVYVEEPLAADSPYRSLPNVISFPHIAGPTFDVREQVVLALLDDVLRTTRGEPVKLHIPYEHAVRMTA